MAFVVDGAEWNFDGWAAADVMSRLDCLLSRVEKARERQEKVWIGDDLQTRHVLGKHDIWALLSPNAPITLSMEIGQELAAWLGKAQRYSDEKDWPKGFPDSNIKVDCLPELDNLDQGWAHHHVRNGVAVACLSLRRAGAHSTESKQGVAEVHWVLDEKTNKEFWRAAFDVEGGDSYAFERIAPHAFPNLYFHRGIWRGLRKLAGGFMASRTEVVRYLSIVNDFGTWAFTCPPPALLPSDLSTPGTNAKPSNQNVISRFRRLGLDIAPENPDVYADSKSRNAREINIKGTIFYCEWHCKLEAHRNRIHIHPPAPESNGQLIIGIAHEHLWLPG